ncbi:MAG: peptidase S46 [Bacteroidetes bacterium GWA2_31_9]|nr:MAG: peptidase S46 [Bacteroidetes bacterium GWA2_31_9]
MYRNIRIILLSITLLTVITFKIYADEGMWIPMLINKNMAEMKRLGLKLSAEDIYNINNASLKDAIVQFGNGCTGEVVSSEGLVFTNHHCGFGQIQAHSTVEHDYLADGFWAMSKAEELSNPGLTVKFLVRMEEVTQKVLAAVSDTMTEKERDRAIDKIQDKITAESITGTGYDAIIKSFFDGNQYFMFVYEIYKDVRLVGAPPSSIGKFGGDTDNWMWPRHTGDFSIFRVYMGKDGKPAEYSADNVPYKPKHSLPVSLNGVKANDYAMILGYPGRTNRYLNSYGVKQNIELLNPSIVKIRDKKLEIMREGMNSNHIIKIQYASKYARTSNYWKYFIGQTKQLVQNKVYEKKVEIENEFTTWANNDSKRKEKYGKVLSEIEKSWIELKDYNLLKNYLNEAALGVELFSFSFKFQHLYNGLRKDEKDSNNVVLAKELIVDLDLFYKDLDLNTDKKLFISLMTMFREDIPTEFLPTFFTENLKKHKEDIVKYADYAYSKSIFISKEKASAFLKNPDFKTLDKDPIFSAMYSIVGNFRKHMAKYKPIEENRDKNIRLFIEGTMEMHPEKNFYPNANSSMRLTYGTVQDYAPRDAVEYELFTTIDGIIEKENDESDEFVVPKKLKELYQTKDYGIYGEDGNLKVCFLTTNDITGGNSGSPVINGNGELIGIAFDGNWEAMSGDISFEPSVQRTIVVDIRYVLFIIDKFAGAGHLVKELQLAKS